MPNVERAGRVDPRCISCDSRCLAGDVRGKHTSQSSARSQGVVTVRCPRLRLLLALPQYPFAHLRARGQGEPVEQSGEASNSERNIFIPTCGPALHCIPHTRHVRTERRPSAWTEQPWVPASSCPLAPPAVLLARCPRIACTLEMKPCGQSWPTLHCKSSYRPLIGPFATIQPGSYRPRVPLSRLHMRPRGARLAT
jgi:hypothetical protein